MKRFLVALGISVILFGGGFAASQVWGRIITPIEAANPGEMSKATGDLIRDYADLLRQVKSAPQASQVSNETGVYLQYAIIRQNDEMIRLLKKIAKE
jgi:hypothetical protein